MYLMIGRYRLKAGCRETLLAELKTRKLAERFQQEQGNVEYTYLLPLKEENVLRVLEVWKDKAAFEAHKTCEAAKEWSVLSAEYILEKDNHRYEAAED